MEQQDRREEWRNFYYDEILSLPPKELKKFRKEKADYDKIYRELHATERAAYKADPQRTAKWNELRRKRYQAELAHPRPKVSEEERRERMRASWRKYAKKNRKRIMARLRSRKKSEPVLRIVGNLRDRLRDFLMGNVRSPKTEILVGCTTEELRNHIESLFQSGMTWENYGRDGWHCDHKRPCSSFDLADPAQQLLCFHFSNLQPLWARDNMIKNARWSQ